MIEMAHVDAAHQVEVALLITLGEPLVPDRLRVVGIQAEGFLEGLGRLRIQAVLQL
jgi:hypothetical protein